MVMVVVVMVVVVVVVVVVKNLSPRGDCETGQFSLHTYIGVFRF